MWKPKPYTMSPNAARLNVGDEAGPVGHGDGLVAGLGSLPRLRWHKSRVKAGAEGSTRVGSAGQGAEGKS